MDIKFIFTKKLNLIYPPQNQDKIKTFHILEKSIIFEGMIDIIKNNMEDIISLCKKHRVKSISLFGSAAKNTMQEESDIDLLVQFSEDIDVLDYADNYFSLLERLENFIERKVDLVSVKSLKNPVLKEEIYSSKVDLYAA